MTERVSTVRDEFCICSIDGDAVAIPAIAVREITFRQPIFPVPSAAFPLVGICHHRNEFLPVLGLTSLLGDEGKPEEQRESMLVINSTEGAYICTIDRALAVEPLETALAHDSRADRGSPQVVSRTATYKDMVVRVLDPQAIYRLATESLRANWAHVT